MGCRGVGSQYQGAIGKRDGQVKVRRQGSGAQGVLEGQVLGVGGGQYKGEWGLPVNSFPKDVRSKGLAGRGVGRGMDR